MYRYKSDEQGSCVVVALPVGFVLPPIDADKSAPIAIVANTFCTIGREEFGHLLCCCVEVYGMVAAWWRTVGCVSPRKRARFSP